MKKVNIIFLFSLIIFLIIGSIYILYSWNMSSDVLSDHALMIAKTSATALNGEMLKQLKAKKDDLGTLAYESVKERLINLARINKDARFVYLYVQRENKIYFIADSEPITSPDYSPPGQEYVEASSDYKKVFSDGNELITKPITDRWGTWISVLAPIKNFNDGKIIGVLGIDYPAMKWNKDAVLYTIQSSVIIFIMLLLQFAFYMVTRTKVKAQENEEKYRLLVESSYDIIYTLSLDGIFTFVSPSWTNLLGYSTKETLGQNFQKFVHPDDLDVCISAVQKVFITKKRQEVEEFRVKHVDGTWKWYSSIVIPIISRGTGVVSGSYGVGRDITKQKEALDAILQLNKYMIGREIKMIDLKKRIKELEKKQNENKK